MPFHLPMENNTVVCKECGKSYDGEYGRHHCPMSMAPQKLDPSDPAFYGETGTCPHCNYQYSIWKGHLCYLKERERENREAAEAQKRLEESRAEQEALDKKRKEEETRKWKERIAYMKTPEYEEEMKQRQQAIKEAREEYESSGQKDQDELIRNNKRKQELVDQAQQWYAYYNQ